MIGAIGDENQSDDRIANACSVLCSINRKPGRIVSEGGNPPSDAFRVAAYIQRSIRTGWVREPIRMRNMDEVL